MYEESVSDNEKFWEKHGKRIDWIKPYSQIKDVTYSKEKVDINQRVIAEFIDLVPLWLAIAYVACFEFLGYIIATFLYVTANMKYLGQKSWGGSAVYGLSLTVTLFTIFYYGLLGELPRGDLLNVHDILPFLDDIRRWIKG